jgi:DNA-directed RNA polymerase specialized sigma24 family protein
LPDSAATQDVISQRQRQLYLFLRALLPRAADTEAALHETLIRIVGRNIRPEAFAESAERIAREVAAERQPPFSADLLRQLVASIGPFLELAEKRPAALEEFLHQLPGPERDLLRRKYELGMTTEQIALAENRAVSSVSRDLVGLHATLVSALRSALPDSGPEPPGGAADLGRLTDQLLDGTITDDGRLVLETLLLADAAAQAHYHRHVALAAELTMRFRGLPPIPEVSREENRRGRVSRREWVVTAAFVAACLAVAGFAVWVVARMLSDGGTG